ncbi:MAG TPA: hypothetical protein VIM24_09105, partial [Candidatus Limnocylindrales bacterium]
MSAAGPVLAHGPVPADPPTLLGLVFGWTLEPAVLLPLLAVAMAWIWIVRRIDRLHPASPVPRRRSVAFLGGLA